MPSSFTPNCGTPRAHNSPGCFQQQVGVGGKEVPQEPLDYLDVHSGTSGGGVGSSSSLQVEGACEEEPSLPLQLPRLDGGAAAGSQQGSGGGGWRRGRERRVAGGKRMWAAIQRVGAVMRTHAGASRARADSAARRMDRMQVKIGAGW